jgi:ketosteroid isomerase-like protein
MTDSIHIEEAATSWIAAWNSGNIKQLMEHYADDVVFYSAAANRRWNADGGKLTGKKALENHFKKAFEEVSGMTLTFRHILFGTDGTLLIYQRETGKMVADLVILDDLGKVKEIRVFNEKESLS